MPAARVIRKPIFDAVRILRGGKGYTQAEVDLLDAAIDRALETPAAPIVEPAPKPAVAPAGAFKLSAKSLEKLEVVHPRLRECVQLAIHKSVVDFGVGETERSLAAQKANVAKGVSRTMRSKHFKQKDGWVWAVDLIAYVGGKVSWEMPLYAAIAYAMDQAATELGIAQNIRWGCAWDRVLSDFGGRPEAYMAEVKAYAARHPGSDLLDGPHFEWVP